MPKKLMRPRVHPVPRLWPGETFFCLASGPSLTAVDVEAVCGQGRVIAVNRTIEMAPWADVWYGCDSRFWKWAATGRIGDRMKEIFETYAGPRFALTTESVAYRATLLGKGSSHGLSLDPMKLCLGGNGGYQAINLAVLMGAKRVVLLGYDMGVDSKGRQHWHADHPMKQRSPYQTFRQAYPTLVEPLKKAGVEVINCTRETHLTCFPRKTLAEVLLAPAHAEVA